MPHNDSYLLANAMQGPVHSTKRIRLINPATEEEIGNIPDCDEEDVDAAVRAARAALPEWRGVPVGGRAALLSAFADAYEKRATEMAALVTHQNGSVISWSRRVNGARPAAIYREYGRVGASLDLESVESDSSGSSVTRREPFGVVGAIIPWNAPQSLLALKLGPALLAGCTVVVKPSPETTYDSCLVKEMLDEVGFPPGVVNIVPGGRDTGAALVSHPRTNKISFTGSTAAGREIASICGRMLKPLTAELGGKSAAIILDDANLETVCRSLVNTCLPNTGQVCYASTRVLIPSQRYQEILDAVIDTLRTTPVGDPTDPATGFGPLVSMTQRDRVEGYIKSGIQEGARVLLGGGRPEKLPVGYYVEPTVFVDVKPNMRVFREEIFGPVLVVVPYDSDDEAVDIANDSVYGLGGSIFSTDVARAIAMGRRLETGRVLINGRPLPTGVRPFGYKNSGVGGSGSLESYLQLKAISVPEPS